MEKAADLTVFDLYYDMAGLAMRTLGRTSDSIRLGLERGFDSGEMMDRIYNNHPSGGYGIGWLIDLFYLTQIGCRGLRGRKAILRQVLDETLRSQREQSIHPVVLDVAAGPATYLVEIFASSHTAEVVAICRDLDENALRRGRALAQSHGLTNIHYELGNALDEQSLLNVKPQPTIVIASGFYELLLDDAIIQRQMQINRGLLAPGGAFIFTTQVNHPQLKLIARALNNREGKPWIMKNRPVTQTEGWALRAGFQTVRSVLAAPGLYAITVAN